MDNVTHALAGLLLAGATTAIVERRGRPSGAPPGRPPRPGLGRTAAIVGVVAAELPDADLLYAGPVLGMGKLGYLLHHRGHTHTVVVAVAAALLVWGVAVAFRRAVRPPAERWALLALALAGTLSHLALDYTNSYGVHPFWPVVNAWYYGDAVFIVEPWLWVAAIPPLLLGARSAAARVPLAVALVAILVAAWSLSLVGRGVALALTVGAAAWLLAVAVAPPARRVAYGLAAWVGVEAAFFAASAAAHRAVRAAADAATFRDVVLTPTAGNPLCLEALVVEVDGATYRVAAAAVAPFPSVRGVDQCAGADVGDVGQRSARPPTRHVRWGGAWSAPRAELVGLARTNCEIAAALRFVRVPAWRRMRDGTVHLSDLRYADRGGFADLVTPPRPAECPRAVPPWVPPRRDVLGPA